MGNIVFSSSSAWCLTGSMRTDSFASKRSSEGSSPFSSLMSLLATACSSTPPHFVALLGFLGAFFEGWIEDLLLTAAQWQRHGKNWRTTAISLIIWSCTHGTSKSEAAPLVLVKIGA